MIDQNTLSQWMDFYRQKGLGAPDFGPQMWGGGALATNPNQQALGFALRMAGQGQGPQGMPQGMPQQTDYFKGLGGPQAGVQIGDNPYSSKVNQLMAMQAQTPQPSQMGNNYLARMFR